MEESACPFDRCLRVTSLSRDRRFLPRNPPSQSLRRTGREPSRQARGPELSRMGKLASYNLHRYAKLKAEALPGRGHILSETALHQQQRGLLQQFLERGQIPRARRAVDHAVVAGEKERHTLADDDPVSYTHLT